jgi:NAD(P)-dependent dehydrogenase (short-subunit alcohol dehydrogenase family)
LVLTGAGFKLRALVPELRHAPDHLPQPPPLLTANHRHPRQVMVAEAAPFGFGHAPHEPERSRAHPLREGPRGSGRAGGSNSSSGSGQPGASTEGRGGCVVLVSAALASHGVPHYAAMSAAKAGVEGEAAGLLLYFAAAALRRSHRGGACEDGGRRRMASLHARHPPVTRGRHASLAPAPPLPPVHPPPPTPRPLQQRAPGLMRSAAASYAARGLSVNCVAPGLVDTTRQTERFTAGARVRVSGLPAWGLVGSPGPALRARGLIPCHMPLPGSGARLLWFMSYSCLLKPATIPVLPIGHHSKPVRDTGRVRGNAPLQASGFRP